MASCWPSCWPCASGRAKERAARKLASECGAELAQDPPSTPRALPARRPPSYEFDPFYAWISDEEAQEVKNLRASLTAEERRELASQPEDIRHDLMLCRFLRGHGPRALPALRSFLEFRRENREALARIRRQLPPDMEDFDLSGMGEVAHVQALFVWLQLPSWHGSNDGMPLSIISAGLLALEALGALPDVQVHEWFLTCCEIRSVTLHNQSIRERRMARVVEVRDALGFNWSTFLTSPGVVGKFRIIIGVAAKYPELLGSVVVFNLEPSTWLMRILRRLVPKEMEQKVLLCARGDWEAVALARRGLSPAALLKWSEFVAGARGDSEHFGLTAAWPQAVVALRVPAGAEFAWRAECSARGSKAPSVRVRAHFLTEGQFPPSVFSCCTATTLSCRTASASRSGSWRAPAAGVCLLEAELQGRGRGQVHATLSLHPGSLDSLPAHAAADPAAAAVPAASAPPIAVSASAVVATESGQRLWLIVARTLLQLLFALLVWQLLVPLLLSGGAEGRRGGV